MNIYRIGRKIKRAEIIRPGCPLTEWYKKQADKPDILCNASLYDGDTPCGTIVENGKVTHNAGAGRGFGVKGGIPSIGTPWQGWDAYLTGYNCYVQSGKAILPTWRDPYVFEQSLTRIAIGKINDAWCIAVGSGTLAEGWNGKAYSTPGTFTKECVNQGIEEIVGLDGGGSRALLWLGKWIYTSTRTPYNAIAIWLEPDENDPKEETMKVKCTDKTQTYTVTGIPESGRYISKGDVCTLSNILLKTLLIQITYPTAAGNRTAYIKDIANFTLSA